MRNAEMAAIIRLVLDSGGAVIKLQRTLDDVMGETRLISEEKKMTEEDYMMVWLTCRDRGERLSTVLRLLRKTEWGEK